MSAELLLDLITLASLPAVILVSVWMVRREKKMLTIEKENPAFTIPGMAELRRDPERWLEVMRGKVSVVCSASSPVFTDQGVSPNFVSFVIDTHGEVHDLEEGKSQLKVEANARWLAEALSARYEQR